MVLGTSTGMTPRAFAIGFIRDHEGVLSMRPTDAGNWTGGARGLGALVGSKYGVTAAALARHRGCKVTAITAPIMAGLAIGEATDIALALYFEQPGLDKLPWDRVAASIFDMGWGTGAGQAIKLVQRMTGAVPDGNLGPASVASYTRWWGQRLEEAAAFEWGHMRDAFFSLIATNEGPHDPDREYLKGWNNRTKSFLPGTAWWNAWERKAP